MPRDHEPDVVCAEERRAACKLRLHYLVGQPEPVAQLEFAVGRQRALLFRDERPGIRQAFRIPAAGACREGLPQDVQFPAPEPAQPKGSPGGGNSAGLPIPLHKGRFGIVFRRHRPCPEIDDPDRGPKEICLSGSFSTTGTGMPVAWSRIKRGRVAFDHVEKGLRLYGHVL